MKAGLDGRAEWSDAYQRHFDTCLGCMACVTACPSGVKYDRLIEATRPQVERHGDRSAGDRVFRQLIFGLFPHPNRLRAMTGPLPSNDTRELPERIAATGDTRRRVGLLLGCVQRVFFPHVNHATVRVLAAEGCEVRVPRDQQCCGALMLHAGREAEAAEAARRTIDAFERTGIEQVVINAAGCGSAMKEYGILLRDDPQYAERAKAFAAKCVDVSEVLAEVEPRAPRHPVPLKVAYHDACHLQHAQGIKQPPRRVLQSIPGLEIKEIAESDICCGSAGIYNLLEPDAAGALRDRKVANILRTGADVVASGNPGCMMQIQSGLDDTGCAIRSVHFVEIIDASIRGESFTKAQGP